MKSIRVSQILNPTRLFLTENTSIDEIQKAESEEILAFKYYPAGATTNSTMALEFKNCYKLFELMSKFGIRLCLRGGSRFSG